MKILICHDEYNCLDRATDDQYTFGLSNFASRIAVIFNDLAKNNETKVILPKTTYEFYKNDKQYYVPKIGRDSLLLEEFFNAAPPITISDEEFIDCFDDTLSTREIYEHDLSGHYKEQDYKKLKELYKTKLNGFDPDIIICYPYQSPYIRSIFKGKLILNLENSIFSRNPFPLTIYLDPIGSIKDNFMINFKEDIQNFKIDSVQNEKIENLKKYIQKFFEYKFGCEDLIKPYKEKFKKLVLLPLVKPLRIEGLSDFIDDMSATLWVLKHIPKDIGVIITYHRLTLPFPISYFEYLREQYPNLIFIPELQKYNMASVALFPHIDGIVNQASMTGIMGMIWDLPVVSIPCRYNSWYCESYDIENTHKFIQEKVNRNNILYWYLTRYAIFSNRLTEDKFLENYLKNKLEIFQKNGINFDFYEQIQDIDKISEWIIESLEKSKHKKETTFIQKIFSLKNSGYAGVNKHKIIRILGMQFKINLEKEKNKNKKNYTVYANPKEIDYDLYKNCNR